MFDFSALALRDVARCDGQPDDLPIIVSYGSQPQLSMSWRGASRHDHRLVANDRFARASTLKQRADLPVNSWCEEFKAGRLTASSAL